MALSLWRFVRFEDSRFVHTPRFDHERRAVDVNRPVRPGASRCDAGRAGTCRYREINIPRTPLLVFGGDEENFKAIGRWAGTISPIDKATMWALWLNVGYQPRTQAKISGATMVASDSTMNLGVLTPSLPHVIFSLGTAPE